MSEAAEIIKSFGKLIRDKKCEIEKMFYNDISSILTDIRFNKFSSEELEELILSLDEVLDSCGDGINSSNNVERELLKAKNEVLKMKNNIGRGIRQSMVREARGRQVKSDRKNDSGVYSTDSAFLRETDPTEHDENKEKSEQPDTRTFSDVACNLVTSPTDERQERQEQPNSRLPVSHDEQEADSSEA